MSSTNRSLTKRSELDYYVTPQKEIENFFDHWIPDIIDCEEHSVEGPGMDIAMIGKRPDLILWLDPCAGGDTEHEMSYPEVIKRKFNPGILLTIDIREDSKAKIKKDYLKFVTHRNFFDVIITNPPFYLAQEIVEKALQDVKSWGYVVMLLRLNFLGSEKRFKFWRDNKPAWVYVHHNRMSFTDDGNTDSIEYAHFVWKKDYHPQFSMLKVI